MLTTCSSTQTKHQLPATVLTLERNPSNKNLNQTKKHPRNLCLKVSLLRNLAGLKTHHKEIANCSPFVIYHMKLYELYLLLFCRQSIINQNIHYPFKPPNSSALHSTRVVDNNQLELFNTFKFQILYGYSDFYDCPEKHFCSAL